jgi:D-3-phosphoglycerate dehydrogenase
MTEKMVKVAVTDFGLDVDVERAILEPLGCHVLLNPDRTGKDQKQLIEFVKDADYVITQFAPVNAVVIAAMQKARIIVRYGIGVDNVDLKAAAAKGIPVCNVPDYCTDEVADHTLALMLATTRQIVPCANIVKAGQWRAPSPPDMFKALKNMTIGLVGLGRIGREVAARLKPFKCRIAAYDPALDAAAVRKLGADPLGFDQLLNVSDLISLHCPSTDKTRYMINARTIARMKKGVILINVSRGTLVQTNDLIAALRIGHISAAALDVTDPEPINADSPLLKMDNVIIVPHMASCSIVATRKLREDAAKTVACLVRGEKLPNVVNGVF